MVDGWGAAYHSSFRDVVGDTALGYGYGSVSDFYVAAYAYLPGEDYVVAYFGCAGQAYLGAEQCVMAQGAAVTYVDEVVDFCALSYAGFAYAGPVYAGIRLNLGFGSQDYVSRLHYFVPAGAVVFRKAEAVGADDGSILQEDVVAEVAELSDHGVGMREEIVAYLCSPVDHYMGEEDGVVSYNGVLVDHYVGSYVRVFAQGRFRMDYGGGMDSRGVSGRLIEKLYGLGPGEVGVVAAQHSGGQGGEILGYDHGRGFRRLCGDVVLRIGDEGQLAWGGLFYAGYSGDFGVGGCVFQAGIHGFGYVE